MAHWVDSRIWQAHFEAHVERELVRGQLEEAAASPASFDPDRVLLVLGEIEEDQLVAQRGPARIPAQAVPRMVGRGLQGAALEAARAWGKGERDRALEILRAPERMNDAQALHVRAQLLDELSQGLPPLYRLGVIRLYREALLLDARSEAAGRARVRTAQILLELGLVPEARAELDPHLEGLSGSAFEAGVVTLAEATYRAGDPTRSIELLARLDLETLSPELRSWELERRADSFFALRRFAEALELYGLRFASGEVGAADARAVLRHAYSLLLYGRGAEAQSLLEVVLRDAPLGDAPLEALVRLVQARVLREAGKYPEAVRAAAAVPPLWPGSEIAALGAVEALESARLSGSEALALPPGTAAMVEPTSPIPAHALLAYRIASRAVPGDGPAAVIDRIGTVLIGVRPGTLQTLAQDDLTQRLAPRLRAWALGEAPADLPELDVVERYLRPQLMGENELLLAVESFARAGRRSTCVRWSQVLQQRERRPLRRGCAAWRRALCLGVPQGDGNAAQRLLADADSGETGPFALAMAALAAENELRAGRVESAVDGYTRALLALAEPRVAGPVLLRAGELEVDVGRPSLALRDLLRGMAQTEDLQGDPLRAAGLLALVRLARSSGGAQGLPALLERARRSSDGWWGPAWTYFARHDDAKLGPPEGSGPFARAAREFEAVDRLAARVRERAAARARAVPTQEELAAAIEDAVAAGTPEDVEP